MAHVANAGISGNYGRLSLLLVAFVLSACSDDDPPSDGTGGAATGGSGGSAGAATGGAAGASQGGSSGAAGGSAGASQGGSSGTAGGTPNAPLFMQAPDCAANVEKLQGSFQAMAVTQDRALAPSVLYDRYYYTVSAARARVRLEWANPLAANVVQPLTGGYLLSSWDATNPEVLYCIVAGEIGLVEGEYFKYSISRMQSGEVGMTQFEMSAVCDGPEFDVELWGCVNRD